MKCIGLALDPELDAAFPHKRAARITMQTRNGRYGEFLQSHRKGDPEAPLTDEELANKYLELVVPVLGIDQARTLLQRLWELEALDSVAELATAKG